MFANVESTPSFTESSVGTFVWLLIGALILIHVHRECRQLGEGFGKFILLVFMFWPIFYPLWLLVWPGSLRLSAQGKCVAETPLAKSIARRDRAKKSS